MHSNDTLVDFLVDEGFLKTPRIIDAFRAIDRADFVLPEYQGEAYGNYPLPIGHGQTISQPLTVAFMLELLESKPGERILDIGAGSGWTTALLAHIVRGSQKGILRQAQEISPKTEDILPERSRGTTDQGNVVAIERIPELCEFARQNLVKSDFNRGKSDFTHVIEFHCQDATRDIPDGSYDKIIAAASASKEIPDSWRRALKVGGKIVAPVGGSIWLFTKVSEDEWDEEEFPGFTFVPLVRDKSKIKNQKSKLQIKNKKYLLYSFLLFTLLFLIFTYEVYLPHPASVEEKTVVIASGLGSRKIGALLKQEGVIRSKWTFVAYVSLRGEASLLKPGVYEFTNAAIPAIARDLVAGENAEVTLVIPEGWTNRDIAELLEKEGVMPAEEFLAYLNDLHFEGYLFPDTYRVFRHADAKDIADTMRENFERKLTPELQTEITRQKKSIEQIVIMASLIEREVRSEEDRALVSGILWKRLEADMPLQVDATITYIKNQESIRQLADKNQGNGKISIADTKIDSPHNTYLYKGLPKGPIGNPGLSAIRAAIYPKNSPYWYYLSSPDGATIYSRTLAEHNRAKERYLR